jgi:pimeloyl-ACP methyl ester carboxylesterase
MAGVCGSWFRLWCCIWWAGLCERRAGRRVSGGGDGGRPAGGLVTRELALPDGRVISYCMYGPEDGRRVVFEFGTPSTRFLAPYWVGPVDELGIRLLVADRPGYGGSTRLAGRSVAARTDDLAAVTGYLGWERFAVWGASGGAPHALACAARLGDRVTRCASVVSPAPFDAVGLDWYDGMPPGNVEEFTCARAGEVALRPLVEQLARDAVAAAENGQPPVTVRARRRLTALTMRGSQAGSQSRRLFVMASVRTSRRGRGEDSIYFDAEKNRCVGAVSLGHAGDGSGSAARSTARPSRTYG